MSDETTPPAVASDPLLDATARSLLLARDAIDAALSNVAALRSRPAPATHATRVVQRDPNAVPPTLGMHRRETTTTTTAKESANA